MIDSDFLKKIFPYCKNVEEFKPPLNAVSDQYNINTNLRLSMFLAQIGHESQGLTRMVENLNYSAEALMRTWPKRFPTPEIASEYARQPEKIANKVYADRLGNGPTESGDGWRFRGRGLIQVTGRSHYKALAVVFGRHVDDIPGFLETPVGATWSAGWFWASINANFYADQGDLKGCTLKINGGLNGIEDRQKLYDKILKEMGVS